MAARARGGGFLSSSSSSTVCDARAMEEVSLDGGEAEAPDPSAEVGTPGEELVERVREGDDPLPIRGVGQDVVDEVGGGLGHAPGSAPRADEALLAGECNDPVEAAGVAAPPGEALVRVATASESFEELDAPGRQREILPSMGVARSILRPNDVLSRLNLITRTHDVDGDGRYEVRGRRLSGETVWKWPFVDLDGADVVTEVTGSLDLVSKAGDQPGLVFTEYNRGIGIDLAPMAPVLGSATAEAFIADPSQSVIGSSVLADLDGDTRLDAVVPTKGWSSDDLLFISDVANSRVSIRADHPVIATGGGSSQFWPMGDVDGDGTDKVLRVIGSSTVSVLTAGRCP